ncbi:MAG TPA: hypothetical protein VM660_03090 [Bacillus sp. (in: firmicutes)]|nr:hypothetical protein [Bacillus sp. (in: firmicutes)]
MIEKHCLFFSAVPGGHVQHFSSLEKPPSGQMNDTLGAGLKEGNLVGAPKIIHLTLLHL